MVEYGQVKDMRSLKKKGRTEEFMGWRIERTDHGLTLVVPVARGPWLMT